MSDRSKEVGGEESARCSCEWMSPEDGGIGHEWPAVLDPQCRVHGEPNGMPRPWWVRGDDAEDEPGMLDTEEWERYREKYPNVVEKWERLAGYVEHRAWGPGRNEPDEHRSLEWTTTGLRLKQVGNCIRYLMDRLEGYTFDVLGDDEPIAARSPGGTSINLPHNPDGPGRLVIEWDGEAWKVDGSPESSHEDRP